MLLSMTGYGRVTHTYGDKTISIELRSLNSKYTDIRAKIPQNYKEKEPELRRILTDKVHRGKIELVIDVQSAQGDDEYGLNPALFRKYHRELQLLSDELGIENGDMLQAILRIPNVITTAADTIDEEEWKEVLKALDIALDKFEQYRNSEGKAMEEDMIMRVDNISGLLHQLDPHEEERIERLRQRIYKNLEEYVGKNKVDENRFEQEILYYLEKIDITEEKVRLDQHCKYYKEELAKTNPLKGRKLSFISQEMGREINTMGAKANSSNIQRLVVGMKDELEKIKEQVANSV
ncbi:MAG TPA: YicC/YloC family endoribonuclease [Phaeodactylibacter sp.]|nr:YicC/YloC family endoribonuclease [Phaeodactylibacter sp.]